MNDSLSRHIVIAGGGITGLASAYLAMKSGAKVTVLEASSSFGGLLESFQVGGEHLECFYHHFFTHDAELNWLIDELDLREKVNYHPSTMGVFRGGEIYDFNSPFDLFKFKPIDWLGKFRFIFSSLFLGRVAQWEKHEGVACLDWFYRWAGKSATEALWKPMLEIKFGPFARVVPLAWMIGRLRQRMNSREKGDERLGYMDGSLKALVDRLKEILQAGGVELKVNCPIQSLLTAAGKFQAVQIKEGEMLEADKVLLTIPSPHLVSIFKPINPSYARIQENVQYFGAMCVILEMKKPLSDIYWLNVAEEGFPFGGVIEHTNFIPADVYDGKYIAYLSRYFSHDEEIASMDDGETEAWMLNKLPDIYPSFKRDDVLKVHVFKTKTGATVCDLNFSSKVPSCVTPVEDVYVANMAHIYPDERSTNNSIRIAAEACKTMGLPIPEVPYGSSLSGKIGFK